MVPITLYYLLTGRKGDWLSAEAAEDKRGLFEAVDNVPAATDAIIYLTAMYLFYLPNENVPLSIINNIFVQIKFRVPLKVIFSVLVSVIFAANIFV